MLWVFGIGYAALAALHAPYLRLPYYWDEAGYFIPAALDCFRHGWLVPRSTLINGHPPLLALWLALAWRMGGFHPLVTRLAMLVFAAALLAGLYCLARESAEFDRRAGLAAVLLCGAAPLFFAQSSLAQLDLPAAAALIWALVYRRRGRFFACSGLVVVACLFKETALIAPCAWLAADGWYSRRRAMAGAGSAAGLAAALAPPAAAAASLAGWFCYVHHATGYWLGTAPYLTYNLAVAQRWPRVGLALLRHAWQLGGYGGVGLVSLLAFVGWRRKGAARASMGAGPSAPAARVPTSLRADCWALIAAYLAFHALVGGAVLARYLLPALALYLLLAADALLRLPRSGWVLAACTVFLVVNWFWNPPYPFPYEDNLAYTHFVRLQQRATARAQRMAQSDPSLTVWTAWPATDELRNPELGYVSAPVPVAALDDFSGASLARAERMRGPALLLLYSRIYRPPLDVSRAAGPWRRWSQRYFGYRPPAPAAEWTARLGLRLRDRFVSGNQWAILATQ